MMSDHKKGRCGFSSDAYDYTSQRVSDPVRREDEVEEILDDARRQARSSWWGKRPSYLPSPSKEDGDESATLSDVHEQGDRKQTTSPSPSKSDPVRKAGREEREQVLASTSLDDVKATARAVALGELELEDDFSAAQDLSYETTVELAFIVAKLAGTDPTPLRIKDVLSHLTDEARKDATPLTKQDLAGSGILVAPGRYSKTNGRRSPTFFSAQPYVAAKVERAFVAAHHPSNATGAGGQEEPRETGPAGNQPKGEERPRHGGGAVECDTSSVKENTESAPNPAPAATRAGSAPADGGEGGVHHGDSIRDEVSDRSPRCPYLPIPRRLADGLMTWAPELENVPGHRAMVQYDLFGTHYNRSKLDGLVLNHARIAGFYGDTPDMLNRRRPYTTTDLIDLYRSDVDDGFTVSDWNRKRGLARVITDSGIPDELRDLAKRAMLDPFEFEDWVVWINGKSANRRNATKAIREERMKDIEEQETTIESPEPLHKIQDYLNDLPQRSFAHGGYGLVSRLEDTIEAAKEMDWPSEEAKDGELRKLYWLKHYPQPLYKRCDRFPRLKSDPYNQLMNLTSELRPHLYSERDVELDLEKAHLSSYVPIAEQIGLEMPTLSKYLQDSLDDEIDLWSELADCFDKDAMPDAKGRRKAAKRLYSAVYGSSKNNTTYQILKAYASETGDWAKGEDVRDVFDHEVVEEIYEVRGEIEDHINEKGGLEDAFGRFIPLSAWDDRDEEDRWRGVLAYVNASYELALIWECFEAAIEEQEWAAEKDSRRPRFQIWLLQGDGFTMKVDRKRDPSKIIDRLKERVAKRAEELGMITGLEVANRDSEEPSDDVPGPSSDSGPADGGPEDDERSSEKSTPTGSQTDAPADPDEIPIRWSEAEEKGYTWSQWTQAHNEHEY